MVCSDVTSEYECSAFSAFPCKMYRLLEEAVLCFLKGFDFETFLYTERLMKEYMYIAYNMLRKNPTIH